MKRVLFAATAMVSITLPASVFASAPTPSGAHAATQQSICVPMTVETPDGPVEGVFCFAQGGRV